MSYHILVVDDEIEVTKMLHGFLTKNGYDVSCAADGAQVIQMAQKQPDLILLDINMPQVDGIEVCKAIRDMVTCPILFLTARDQDTDKIEGFAAGGDDYIVKPFEAVELLARIEVVLRRVHKSNSLLTYDDIVVDVDRHTVTKGGTAITLTPREFELLVFFMQNVDIALTRERLLASVWGYRFEGESRTVDIHVQQLRRKMGLKGKLITIPKLGYRLEKGR